MVKQNQFPIRQKSCLKGTLGKPLQYVKNDYHKHPIEHHKNKTTFRGLCQKLLYIKVFDRNNMIYCWRTFEGYTFHKEGKTFSVITKWLRYDILTNIKIIV